MTKLIDSYHSNDKADQEKTNFYQGHVYSEEEKRKTEQFRQRMIDFVTKVNKTENMRDFHQSLEGSIHYIEGTGYIAENPNFKDLVDVFLYGTDEEEAFGNAIVDYEFCVNGPIERKNRKALQESYNRRFLEEGDLPDDYHAPFFFAELSIQDLRKVFGDQIPENLVRYFENYASKIEQKTFKYDYGTNAFVKQKVM